jgi:hypothetical protein
MADGHASTNASLMKVDELKDKLLEFKLSTDGNKYTLKDRLGQFLENQQDQSTINQAGNRIEPRNESRTTDEIPDHSHNESSIILGEVSDDDSDSDDCSDSDDEKDGKSDLSSIREGIEGIKSNLTELCKTLKSP